MRCLLKFLAPILFFRFAQSHNLNIPLSQARAPMALNYQQLAPVFNITLTPRFDHGHASAIRVVLGIAEPKFQAEQILLIAVFEIVTVNICRFKDDVVHAVDDQGELPLDVEQDVTGPTVVFRRWKPKRATEGSVQAWYIALPRLVNETTKIYLHSTYARTKAACSALAISFSLFQHQRLASTKHASCGI
jgi:hypothetical protein